MDDPCADLAKLKLHGAVVESAIVVDRICRINGSAHPVAGSHIRFTVYLPAADRWSGRYYQIGNGGFAGAIHLPTLDEGARRGDAIAATDTGHRGNGFDASWAPGNPVALADYGGRSIKATRDAAQALVRVYYRRDPRYHYFMGCSNGGRMGLMAAARWPEDWDGVIAGAPANPWTTQLRRFGEIRNAMHSEGGWIGPTEVDLIRRTALAACPAGSLRRGIAQQPGACRPDWTRLACRGRMHSACLSAAQHVTLGHIIKAGYEPAAMGVADWQQWIGNRDPSAQSQRSFAEQSRQHLFSHYTDSQLSEELDVRPADLQRFRDRGGRVLSYFGWADAVIAPGLGLDWYHSVVGATHGNGATTNFYRLFMVPGMQHCQGGSGPVNFGQSLEAPAARQEPRYDIRLSLEHWVEFGSPPDELIAQGGMSYARLRPID